MLLSTVKFSQPHLHTFLVDTLAKDTTHLIDAEASLVAELYISDTSEASLNFGAIYKSWSRHTKHYIMASQHALIAREILRKEAPINLRLRVIIAVISQEGIV